VIRGKSKFSFPEELSIPRLSLMVPLFPTRPTCKQIIFLPMPPAISIDLSDYERTLASTIEALCGVTSFPCGDPPCNRTATAIMQARGY
jgi:hypothetical protein